MKKIEKKGKQKSDTGDSNAASDANVGKVKDENDKPLNYIKDEIQSEWCGLWVGWGSIVVAVGGGGWSGARTN